MKVKNFIYKEIIGSPKYFMYSILLQASNNMHYIINQ